MKLITTYNDLYLAIGELASNHQSDVITLENYLLSILKLSLKFKNQENLMLPDFLQLLTEAFDTTPSPFDENWRSYTDSLHYEVYTYYEKWQVTVILQIVDLREMDESGLLFNEYKYGGIDAPSGNRWYNFDPTTFIKCGLSGSLGRWDSDENTNQQVVVKDDLSIVANSSEKLFDFELPVNKVVQISWEQFEDFVVCGQIYE